MPKYRSLLCWLALAGAVACSNDDAPNSAPIGVAPPVTGRGDGEVTGTSHSGGSETASPASSDSASSAAPAAGRPVAGSATAGMASPSSMAAPTPIAGPATPPSSSPIIPSRDDSNGQIVGNLTAGTWDDNRNFERFRAYRKNVVQTQHPGVLPTKDEEHDSAHEAFREVHGARETLDVSLVIDTTGSMGDEIRYLQSEFLALSHAIEEQYPDSEQRWSLVVYRDSGDVYVTRWFDFRDDAEDFREKLAAQTADGGGDFPEAPDAALDAMTKLAWREDETTARLVFWVADAPHHPQNADAMVSALRAARELDVHIYPVASSGVDELTELTMRSAAQLTGGRYLFLTDDSGIGGTHKLPSIPCYFVTRLDDAILRMVDIELSGNYREPAPDEVIRRGGNPSDGACKLDSGETLQVF